MAMVATAAIVNTAAPILSGLPPHAYALHAITGRAIQKISTYKVMSDRITTGHDGQPFAQPTTRSVGA